MTSILNSITEGPIRYPLTGGDKGHKRSFWSIYMHLNLDYNRILHFERSLCPEDLIRTTMSPPANRFMPLCQINKMIFILNSFTNDFDICRMLKT